MRVLDISVFEMTRVNNTLNLGKLILLSDDVFKSADRPAYSEDPDNISKALPLHC